MLMGRNLKLCSIKLCLRSFDYAQDEKKSELLDSKTYLLDQKCRDGITSSQ
jgi:hypothetical protein